MSLDVQWWFWWKTLQIAVQEVVRVCKQFFPRPGVHWQWETPRTRSAGSVLLVSLKALSWIVMAGWHLRSRTIASTWSWWMVRNGWKMLFSNTGSWFAAQVGNRGKGPYTMKWLFGFKDGEIGWIQCWQFIETACDDRVLRSREATLWSQQRDPLTLRFDIIIVDSTDSGAAQPLFEERFHRQLKQVMTKNSVLVWNSPGDQFHLALCVFFCSDMFRLSSFHGMLWMQVINLTSLPWQLELVRRSVARQRRIFRYVRVFQIYQPTYTSGALWGAFI